MDVAYAIASVRSELARADTKAATLLGLAGTAAGVAATAASFGAPSLPILAQVAVWLAVILLIAAVAVLLYAVRPSLPRRGEGAGWVTYAHTSPASLEQRAAVDYERARLSELIVLSRLAWSKHLVVQVAVDVLLVALVVALIATVLIVRGGA